MKRQVSGPSIDGGPIELGRERRIRKRLDSLADKLREEPEDGNRTIEHLEREAENERDESSN